MLHAWREEGASSRRLNPSAATRGRGFFRKVFSMSTFQVSEFSAVASIPASVLHLHSEAGRFKLEC